MGKEPIETWLGIQLKKNEERSCRKTREEIKIEDMEIYELPFSFTFLQTLFVEKSAKKGILS